MRTAPLHQAGSELKRLSELWLGHLRNLIQRSAVLALVFSAEAHRLDEYLQAALIDIKPDEVAVQLNLTPGVEVSHDVMRLIDLDHNGKISSEEETAYGKALMAELVLRLDDRPVKLQLLRTSFDSVAELKSGTGNMRVELRALIGTIGVGHHTLFFENRHQPKISVYLINAVLPKNPALEIVKQERNENQSLGRVSFSISEQSK